jgi:hypothetical protein
MSGAGHPSSANRPSARDAVALDPDRFAASLNGLVPCSREAGADEAGDHVAIEPMGDHKQFLNGAVRTAGEQF